MRTKDFLHHCLIATGLILLSGLANRSAAADESPLIPVGVARVDITPNGPIRLAGYGNRRTEATSAASKIWAKALAIGSDEQHPCVLITAELIRAPGAVVEPLAERLRKKVGLERSQLAVCVTRTHTGPALASMLVDSYFGSNIPPAQQDRVKRYTERLLDLLEQVALAALDNRQPSRLAWSEGKVGFAVNRRSIRNGRWIGKRINLPLDHIPNRTELEKRLKRGANAAYFAQILLDRLDRGETIPASFSYPVQVWSFGDDLSMVFLAGEVGV